MRKTVPGIVNDQFVSKLRDEARIILYISWRDIVKRLASAAMVLALLAFLGRTTAVIWILLGVVFSEAIFYGVYRHMQTLTDGRELSLPVVLLNWTASTLSTLAFCAPGIVLAMEPELPMILSGFFWIFGVLVHITNSYVALPIYNRSQVIPSYGALLLTILTASQTEIETAASWEWWLLAAFALVYGSNTFQTLTMQNDTQKELDAARAQARARLHALEEMARHDPLTGLRNRSAFGEDFAAMRKTARPDRWAALMVIDLDRFKPINDSYGHDAGDAVLKTISARLEKIAGQSGLAARIGGDEFAIALPDIKDREGALRVGRKAARFLERPVNYNTLALQIGASVGVTLAAPGRTDVRSLIAEADQAMFRAKHDPGTNTALFDQSFAPRLSLEDKDRLEKALEGRQIRPFYQPKICLRSNRIAGFEALARWVLPNGTILSPADFLPQIDELHLHGPLLSCIATQVLEDLTPLRAAGLGARRVAINLPEAALATRSGCDALLALCETAPQALASLTLELTEDILIGRAGSQLQASISALRARGALISLDDFGTGYASFQHLRQLEFDELKIDRSFVSGLCTDETAAVIVEGFLSISRGLGVTVVGEGVETEAQEARLRELGCDFAQGYRYGQAQPIDRAKQCLREDARPRVIARVIRAEASPLPAARAARDGP